MKKTLLIAVPALMAVTPALAAETYTVDKSHATVLFEVRHFMTDVAGRFEDFEGTIRIDREQPERSSVEFTIRTASIDTSEPKRDEHLRSADFFDAATHPEITFRSTAVRPAGEDRYEVTGTFTMRGATKTITLPVRVLGELQDPWGNDRIGFGTSTTLNRKDYGISWNKALDQGGFVLGDEVRVRINLEAVKAKQAAKAN
jgi:polyisoprenoid-binding protein YceI